MLEESKSCVEARTAEDADVGVGGADGEALAPGSPATPEAQRCMACPEPRHGKKKWCLEHNRGAECLLRYAQRSDKNDGASKAEEVKLRLQDPKLGPAMVLKFVQEHPARRRGQKRVLPSFSSHFEHSVGASSRGGEKVEGKRMDLQEYCKYMERRRGWTVERSTQEWNKMLAIPQWPRDFKGPEQGFELRLVIPKGDYVYMSQEINEDKSLVRRSKALKLDTAAEFEELEQETRLGHGSLVSDRYKFLGGLQTFRMMENSLITAGVAGAFSRPLQAQAQTHDAAVDEHAISDMSASMAGSHAAAGSGGSPTKESPRKPRSAQATIPLRFDLGNQVPSQGRLPRTCQGDSEVLHGPE